MAFDAYTYPAISSPAGSHSEGHREDKKRFSQIFSGMHLWVKKKQPSPGAMQYAFSTLALPELSPIDHAICVRKGFSAFALGPQVYVPAVSVPTNGYGGLITGQMISQPLYNPRSNTYAGS